MSCLRHFEKMSVNITLILLLPLQDTPQILSLAAKELIIKRNIDRAANDKT
jgi:hypothetical protein